MKKNFRTTLQHGCEFKIIGPMKRRTLKIEERGDYFAKKTTPVVRLKGRWLQAAGFPAGRHLQLTVISPGVIELRVMRMARAPSPEFQMAAMRLDHAIAADRARNK